MQVVFPPIPQHMNTVPTPFNILVVKRLVEVADEVDDKFGGLGTAPVGQRSID